MGLSYKLKIFLSLLLLFMGSQYLCILLIPSFTLFLQFLIFISIAFIFALISTILSTNTIGNLANKAKSVLKRKGYKEELLVSKNEVEIIEELEDYSDRVYVKGETKVKVGNIDLNEYFDKTALFTNAPYPIFILDVEGIVLSANKEFCILVGRTEDELLNSPSSTIFPSEEDTGKLITAMKRQSYWQGETDLLLSNGDFVPAKVNTSKTIINGTTVIQCFVTDLRDIKRKESEIEKRSKQIGKFDTLMVNREIKMIELKKEIARLNRKIKLMNK